MKKLPEIIITGTPQELVEIETLLVMAGYDDGVGIWGKLNECTRIIGYGDAGLVYSQAFIPIRQRPTFKATEIHKILRYIETGEIKEYVEDKINVIWYKESLDYAQKHFDSKKSMRNKDGSFTHTGQTKVVGNRADKPSAVFSEFKKAIKKIKEKRWERTVKKFNEWANGKTLGSICYYSPGQKEEILWFFKEEFLRDK